MKWSVIVIFILVKNFFPINIAYSMTINKDNIEHIVVKRTLPIKKHKMLLLGSHDYYIAEVKKRLPNFNPKYAYYYQIAYGDTLYSIAYDSEHDLCNLSQMSRAYDEKIRKLSNSQFECYKKGFENSPSDSNVKLIHQCLDKINEEYSKILTPKLSVIKKTVCEALYEK